MYTILDDPQIENIAELYEEHIGYKTNGFFVEVGAFDGYHWSFTHSLAAIGWSGILIEPNPLYVDKCLALYAGRSDVRVVECAVGAYEGQAKLYLGGSVSTLYRDVIGTYNETDGLSFVGLRPDAYIKVAVRTLDDILAEYGCPDTYDLLVIDVEGGEMNVLRGYNIGLPRPKMAIIETHAEHPNPELSYKAIPINGYMRRNHYRLVQQDIINSVYVDDWSK